jgi:hypothetical protein
VGVSDLDGADNQPDGNDGPVAVLASHSRGGGLCSSFCMAPNSAMVLLSPSGEFSRPYSPSLQHTRSMASLTSLSGGLVGEGVESFVQAKAAFDRGYKHMTPRSTILSSGLGKRGLVEHSFINWAEPGETVQAVRPLGYVSPRYPRGAPHLLPVVAPASMPRLQSPLSARPSTTSWAPARGPPRGQSPYRKEDSLAMVRSARKALYTPRPYTAPQPPTSSASSAASPERSEFSRRPDDAKKLHAARATAQARTTERLRRQREEAAKQREEKRASSEEERRAAIALAQERAKEMRKLERKLGAKQQQAAAEAAERARESARRVQAEKDLARQRAREWAAKQQRRAKKEAEATAVAAIEPTATA